MLHDIISAYSANKEEVLAWIQNLRDHVKGPIYNSVDLRNSGFKITSVDTNIFPAGFNNLCPDYTQKTGTLLKSYLEKHHPNTQKIAIFPESHTKNAYYLENLKKLQKIIEEAGYEAQISDTEEELKTSDLILTNNDFSGGIPKVLESLPTPVIPNPNLGWFQRSKYEHFLHYAKLTKDFAKILKVDPWFFTPLTVKVENVNFQEKEGFEKIASASQKLLVQIQEKYNEHGITSSPYVFIKNDSGTYGIAIHHIENPEEILGMNRKTRNKLSTGKDKTAVTDIIIQEGIPTIERFNGMTGEPVIYLIGNTATGGFFRLNEEKDEKSNLNSRGMQFTKLCFHEMFGYENNFPECDLECLEELYFRIAEIGSLASGIEMQEIENLPI
jgi:glutamate--cysteine ligase